MRRLRAVVLAAVAVAGLYCAVSEFRERQARAFCDSLRPLLARYYAEHGHYPESLPPQWYRLSDLPNLVRPDFYLTFSNGQAFLMRFVNPQRPSFDNVVAYQSDIGHWASWDGY